MRHSLFYILFSAILILSAFKSLGPTESCTLSSFVRSDVMQRDNPKPNANIYNWSFFVCKIFCRCCLLCVSGLKAHIISVWREFFICLQTFLLRIVYACPHSLLLLLSLFCVYSTTVPLPTFHLYMPMYSSRDYNHNTFL